MSGIYDYLLWRGDLSFKKDPFNEIDNLILSMAVYVDFKIFVPKYPSLEYVSLQGAIKKYFGIHKIEDANSGLLLGLEPANLCLKLIESNRFKNILVTNFINEVNDLNIEQFSATSFIINDLIYVAYKGTDDTLIGWEENFNMIVDYPIPAQISALRYLNNLFDLYPNHTFIIGGHSKGGNLAIYASTYCNHPEKIKAVYSNDGPGFDKDKLDLEKYENIKEKTYHIIPKDCIIGNILYHPDLNQIIVDSKKNDLYAHSGFTWKIQGKSFITVKSKTKKSIAINKEIEKIISNLTYEDRINISECLYSIISKSQLKTLTDLKNKSIKALLSIRKLSSRTRKVLFKLIKVFIVHNAF